MTDIFATAGHLDQASLADLAAVASALEPLEDDNLAAEALRNLVVTMLDEKGYRECGRCATARPGAVDWGCSCGMTREELDREARAFARIYD
jgi:hypothetical protein